MCCCSQLHVRPGIDQQLLPADMALTVPTFAARQIVQWSVRVVASCSNRLSYKAMVSYASRVLRVWFKNDCAVLLLVRSSLSAYNLDMLKV